MRLGEQRVPVHWSTAREYVCRGLGRGRLDLDHGPVRFVVSTGSNAALYYREEVDLSDRFDADVVGFPPLWLAASSEVLDNHSRFQSPKRSIVLLLDGSFLLLGDRDREEGEEELLYVVHLAPSIVGEARVLDLVMVMGSVSRHAALAGTVL